MNERLVNSLKQPFKAAYGRMDSLAEIKEFTRFYEKSQLCQNNPFLNYAIVDKEEANSYELPKKIDEINFDQIIERVTGSLNGNIQNNKLDTMAIDSIFRVIDQDGDGYIGIDDFLNMKEQLGLDEDLNKDTLRPIFQKVSEQGDKIDQKEFSEIFWM